MTLLELVAGLIFVKGFKVRLWDYTNDRGNFKGIICLNLVSFGYLFRFYSIMVYRLLFIDLL